MTSHFDHALAISDLSGRDDDAALANVYGVSEAKIRYARQAGRQLTFHIGADLLAASVRLAREARAEPIHQNLLASADALAAAVEALPIGRDIRGRMLARIDGHAALIRCLSDARK